jgi:hypothetical protein
MTLKFNNKPTVVDGVRFDSGREARRYSELRLLERAGEISDLEIKPTYVLTVNGFAVGKMIPDFRYRRGDQLVCEDVKSKPTITPMFRWKAKHLLHEHGVKVELVL